MKDIYKTLVNIGFIVLMIGVIIFVALLILNELKPTHDYNEGINTELVKSMGTSKVSFPALLIVLIIAAVFLTLITHLILPSEKEKRSYPRITIKVFK